MKAAAATALRVGLGLCLAVAALQPARGGVVHGAAQQAQIAGTWRGSSTLKLAARGAFVREGEERRAVPGFVLRQTERAEFLVVDRVLDRKEGRAVHTSRRFERARTAGEVVEPVGRTPFERRSRLEGREVLFERGSDGEEGTRRFAEPDGDPALLAGLEAPLDALDFGIRGPLELGRRIPLPAAAARHLFLPFGHLRTDAEAGGGPWQPLLRRALLELEGDLVAVVERLEQRSDGSYAHLRLAGAVGSNVQEPPVEGTQQHGIDLTFRVEAGLVVRALDHELLSLEADLAVDLVRRQEVLIETKSTRREIEFDGRFELKLTKQ